MKARMTIGGIVILILLCLCIPLFIQKSKVDIQSRIHDCIAEKKYPEAIFLLEQIECDEAMQKTLGDLRYRISGKYIANLGEAVAAIDEEGKVLVAVNTDIFPESYLNVTSEWENMRMIFATGEDLDGIDRDGVFWTTTQDNADYQERNQRLFAIGRLQTCSAYWNCFAVTGFNGELYLYSESNDLVSRCSDHIASWENVVDLVAGPDRFAVLFRDGTVDYIYENELLNESGDKYNTIYRSMKEWTEIVDIEGTMWETIVGLRADGTVVVTDPIEQGYYQSYQYDVSDWSDIIAISKSDQSLLGLKRDGTVVLTGPDNKLRDQVESWQDIVAIAAGNNFHIGLKEDGTMVIAGKSDQAESLPDMSEMNHLLVPDID